MSEQKLSTIQKRNNLNAVYRDGAIERKVYRKEIQPEPEEA